MEAKKNNELIYTVGDYDADGVFSLAELDLLYKELGIKNYILFQRLIISKTFPFSTGFQPSSPANTVFIS